MDNKTIEAIQARIDADSDYISDLNAYDAIVNMRWELPGGWNEKTWIRKRVSTDGHDAIKTATNIYDTNHPKWEILPLGLADKERAEQLETALEWWMQRANKLGEGEPFRKSLHNSCLQNCVIYQLDYLPYWLPKDRAKWTKEQKAAMKRSSFCVTVHDRRNVFYEMGKYGLKWAAAVSVMTAREVLDHWSAYEGKSTDAGKSIRQGLDKVRALYKDDDEVKFVHVDYTSHDKREVSLFKTSSDDLKDFENYDTEDATADRIDLLDTEYKLSFINWVIVSGESTPLLYSIHKAGLWENQNLYDTLIESTTMRRAVFPILKHTSPSGKELDVDYNGEQDVIEMTPGENVDTVVPPPIDAAMAQISSQNTAKIAQATGIKGLASVEVAGNVQYAAIQAVIKLHMTTLVPYVRTVEKANAQLGDMAFLWLQEGDGYTEVVYRTTNKGEGRERGMSFTVSPDDFDPDAMFIECHLIANTPNDKQQEINMYAQLKQAGAHIAWKELLERLQLGNGDVLEAEWLDEEAQTAALQNKVKELDGLLQLKIEELRNQQQMALQQQIQAQQQAQLAQQQAQMQAQAAQGGQVPPEALMNGAPEGAGFNAAMGGQPTAEALPGATSPV